MALTDKLTAIADAIRSKGGTTDQLTLTGMVDAINAIQTGSGGGTGLAYDMGEFVFDADTTARNAVAINHNLGDTPGFVLVWTDDFAGLNAENTATQQCNLGYLWFDKLTGMTQRFTSAASSPALTIYFNLSSGEYRINAAAPSSAGYAVIAPTKEVFYISLFGGSFYWRAGVKYKYFVSRAWWNIGGVANTE